MEIVKYDDDEHAEYLPDHHPPKYRDGDIEKFKPVAEEALTEVKNFVEFEDDIELILGVTDVEELGADSPTGYYFMGFSFCEGLHDYPRNAICMRASDRPNEWKEAFKGMFIHELGHQVFYQRDVDWEDDQYHSIMFEGHAENLARIVGERNGRSFSPVWRKEEPIDIHKQELYIDLEKPRGFDNEDHNMFLQGGDRWSDAEGYTIAYQIVHHLIEEDRVSINSMLEKPSEEWRELVDEAIEELY